MHITSKKMNLFICSTVYQCCHADRGGVGSNALQQTTTHYNTLQHTATYCNTLQHTATHCNTLQHTATHLETCIPTHVLQMNHMYTHVLLVHCKFYKHGKYVYIYRIFMSVLSAHRSRFLSACEPYKAIQQMKSSFTCN